VWLGPFPTLSPQSRSHPCVHAELGVLCFPHGAPCSVAARRSLLMACVVPTHRGRVQLAQLGSFPWLRAPQARLSGAARAPGSPLLRVSSSSVVCPKFSARHGASSSRTESLSSSPLRLVSCLLCSLAPATRWCSNSSTVVVLSASARDCGRVRRVCQHSVADSTVVAVVCFAACSPSVVSCTSALVLATGSR
jgi:hypothetical protein